MPYYVINGTNFDDTIYGTAKPEVINGNGGNDIIYGWLDDDILDGGTGIDFLFGESGEDLLYGGAGSYTDFLYGGDGNDRLAGGFGADVIDGGSGIDTALYTDSNAAVVVNLAAGTGSGGTAQGDTLWSIENVYGSAYADTLTGNQYDNTFRGGYGADALSGGAGSDTADYSDTAGSVVVSLLAGAVGNGGTAEGDTYVSIENVIGGWNDDYLLGNSVDNVLKGMNGDDTLKGAGGADELWGGDGVDTVSYEGSDAAVLVLLPSGHGYNGHAEGDLLFDIENVNGSSYGDSLHGDNDANVLRGLNGNDYLYGYDGADRLEGGSGQDVLSGGNHADILIGGLGFDTLTGGGHGDTFVWTSTAEMPLAVPNVDVITDFNYAEGDRIDLSGVDANVYAAGNQAFTFVGATTFSGTPGEINYVYFDDDTYIQLQTGTSADIEGVIRLPGIHEPQASWFIL